MSYVRYAITRSEEKKEKKKKRNRNWINFPVHSTIIERSQLLRRDSFGIAKFVCASFERNGFLLLPKTMKENTRTSLLVLFLLFSFGCSALSNARRDFVVACDAVVVVNHPAVKSARRTFCRCWNDRSACRRMVCQSCVLICVCSGIYTGIWKSLHCQLHSFRATIDNFVLARSTKKQKAKKKKIVSNAVLECKEKSWFTRSHRRWRRRPRQWFSPSISIESFNGTLRSFSFNQFDAYFAYKMKNQLEIEFNELPFAATKTNENLQRNFAPHCQHIFHICERSDKRTFILAL